MSFTPPSQDLVNLLEIKRVHKITSASNVSFASNSRGRIANWSKKYLGLDTPLPEGKRILGSLSRLTLTGVSTNQNRGQFSPSV